MLHLFRSKPDLVVHSEQPFNAEPPLARLRAAYVTPQRDFYVRTHGSVPDIDPSAYRLRVDGRVAGAVELDLAALRERLPRRTVMAVMQCAGNRRADLRRVRPVKGDPWAPGAIGNAEWAGVALADVLRAAGAETEPGLHVVFSSLDECEAGGERFRYAVSIPMEKAVAPEVLLAYEMNGEALAPAHGFPLRAVVPGYAGVRSAKWLTGITVQDRPSNGHCQARDYKLFPPDVTEDTADWSKGISINEMPLNAAICEPAPHAELKPGPLLVRGYAIATGRSIARVDVSVDGGRTWRQAELEHDAKAPWSWTFWQTMIDLPAGEHELVVRAWDCAGQTQPAAPDDTWNFKGYLSASWHRVLVTAG